jgi:predicted permease
MAPPWSELRFAARRLRRAPGFSAAVVMVLSLGIGATTAVFSLVNAILIEPLPFPEADRLVRLAHVVRDARATVDQSDATVQLYRSQAQAFDGVAGWRFDDGNLGATQRDQTAIRVRGARVTSNFFDVLAVPPARGRVFTPGEDSPGTNRVVVLSHRIWQERFQGAPDVVGRQLVVNDVVRTIVGVMPEGFAYPADHVDIWLPLALDPAHLHPAEFNLVGIGRLKRGVSPSVARADLARVLDARTPAAAPPGDLAPAVESLRESVVGPVSHLLWLVFAGVGLVLVVSCTNAAGLLLVRTERMQVEIAVRGALGSGIAGILALILGEATLLGAAAGGAGVGLAALAMRLAPGAFRALDLPSLQAVAVHPRVLLFALGITVLSVLAVSAVPVLRARRAALAQVLRGAGSAATRSQAEVRHAFVIAQVALGVVLVAASVLMTRSFLRLSAVQPGFDPDRVVTARVLLPFARYEADSRLRFFEALVSQARALPGVRNVGLTDWVPLSGDRHDTAIEVEGNPFPASHPVATADASYFETLRIPLLEGRTFGERDPAHPASEVIVTRAFAARYWPGTSPLGRRVRPLGGSWSTVVGEVGDVHHDGLDRPPGDLLYFPVCNPGALSLIVRTDAPEGDTLAAVRSLVRALDPAVPTYDEGSMRRVLEGASARARTLALLLAASSAVASLLAAVGLYGVIAYTVSLRRRELGIRMALGARPRDLSRMMSLVGLRLAAAGIAIGLACTPFCSGMLRRVLYGVSPTDPVTLIATAMAVLVLAFVATWIPARRAAAVPPAEALRSP